MFERYRTQVVVIFIGLLAVGLVALFYRQEDRDAIRIVLPTPTVSGTQKIKVHVAGAVQKAGVYELRDGDRVEDALRVAGGAAPDADLEGINLAAKLRDAQQVHVPRLGEPSQSSTASGQGSQRVNINTASPEVLDTLPGIGPTRSKNIVDSRVKDGPFKDPRDLVDRKLIPASTYERIKDRLVAE